MLPVGEYPGEVIAQDLIAAGTGTPQAVFKVRLDNQQDSNGYPVDRTVFCPITDKTIERFADDLVRQFGKCPAKPSELDPTSPSHMSYLGCHCMLWCSHETYEGTTREKWKFSNPDAAGGKKLPDDDLMKLDALFGAAFAGKAKKTKPLNGGSPPPVKAERPAAATADDEIPF